MSRGARRATLKKQLTRKFQLEPLEDRLVLTTFMIDGSVPGDHVIDGTSGDDNLIIDFSRGVAGSDLSIQFDGRDGYDTIAVQGGALAEFTYSATGPEAGQLGLDGTTVAFADVEPLTISASFSVIKITVNDGLGHTVVLQDEPGLNNSTVTIDGGLESVTFVNPSSQLTIDTGDGEDTIIVKSLETSFPANILINGGNDNDTFEVVPNLSAGIYLNGGLPNRPDAGIPPGDVLALDLDNVIGADVQGAASSGVVTSLSHANVQWIGMETLITPDDYEWNDSIDEATVLGSLAKITLNDLSIHPRLDASTGIPYADIVVVVDESTSMEGEHEFLQAFIPDLEKALTDVGVGLGGIFGGNQYGLVGFGGEEESAHFLGHSHLVAGTLFGSASEFVTAAGTLVQTGEIEDGYDGVDFALDRYPFRDDAARLIILVTDEDRDVVNAALSKAGVSAALQASGVTLHGILDVTLEDGGGATALAVDASGTAYISSGFGGVTVSSGGVVTGGFENTVDDYVDLVFDGAGLVGDLNQLRAGDNTAAAFSSAMLIGLVAPLDIQPLPADVDVFQYTAQDSGMLIVNMHLDDDIGNLNLRVLDSAGNVIATSEVSSDNEQIVMPVVTQEQYFIQVAGATDDQVNGYALEIENFPAPAPTAVYLDPALDTGRSNSDNVTAVDEPRFLISADLDAFGFAGIPIDADGDAGADVRIDITGVDVNFDSFNYFGGVEISLLGFDNWEYSPALADGTYEITARVSIVDGADNVGFSLASPPLVFTIDTTSPDVSQPVLLGSSDTGDPSDGVTGVRSPAFTGVAEENALVRLYAVRAGEVPDLATAWPIGEGMATGIHPSDGLGTWEITSEPLADGEYDVFVVVIDAAGNASDVSVETPVARVVIDTVAPQRPTLDLIDSFDTGASATDNNTRLTTLHFRVTGDAGDTLVVKDGNTVIAGPFLMPASGEALLALDFVALQGVSGFDAEGPHPLSAESTDLAGNRSDQSEELLVTIDQTAPMVTIPDLLAASDTGLEDFDDVTAAASPAFAGVVSFEAAEAGVKVFLGVIDSAGNEVIVGETDLLLDDGAIAQLEPVAWEITSEPLDDDIYQIFAIVQDAAGNVYRSDGGEVPEYLTVEIDTLAPNTPLLDLLTDSGRHDDDNITNDSTPTMSMTTEDPTADPAMFAHLFAENLNFRIFVRPEGNLGVGETLVYESLADLGGLTTLEYIVQTLTLTLNDPAGTPFPDGLHNFKLEVADRAGNISEDFLLDVLIDTVAYLGAGDLHPESDSGVVGYPATNEDRITNDKTPEFFGIAEADNLVYVTIDGVAAGTGVAVPGDGDDGFQPVPGGLVEGNWQILTNLNLADGQHEVVFTFEDVAGNRVASEPLLIFVDTQGPRVFDDPADAFGAIHVTADDPNTSFDEREYDLFRQKGELGQPQPTPRIDSLTIHIEDLPARTADFLYEALFEAVATNPGHYLLVGDANGIIAIDWVEVINAPRVAGEAATATIVLHFAEPLPDDRFTLTISDALVDPAGNQLDGETDAVEPSDNPLLPSGDGVPGGTFAGRFTVDSRPEIGVTAATRIYLDINGNFVYDPAGSGDLTNRDLIFQMGLVSDAYFAGNFNDVGAGAASGFDKLGAYGWDPFVMKYRFLLDFNHNGVPDFMSYANVTRSALPVAGDFSAVHSGDEIGLFTGDTWYLDANGDNVIDVNVDTVIPTAMRGIPVVGDVNGDGADDLITYDAGADTFYIDLDRDGQVDDTIEFGIPDYVERPVVGDMNLDGVDDLGLWVAGNEQKIGEGKAEWYFLISDRVTFVPDGEAEVDDLASLLFDPYSPDPLGNDLFANFGDRYSLPIFGNFDPPVAGDGSDGGHLLSYTNTLNARDVNGDGMVSPIDALLVINHLNSVGSIAVPEMMVEYEAPAPFLDVTADRYVSAIDALNVINFLNRLGEGEGEAGSALRIVTLQGAGDNLEPSADALIGVVLSTDEVPQVEPSATPADATAVVMPGGGPAPTLLLTGQADASSTVAHEASTGPAADDADWEDLLDLVAADVRLQWWKL